MKSFCVPNIMLYLEITDPKKSTYAQ